MHGSPARDVVEIDLRCEEAREHTSSIVDLIERSPARTVDGLSVKQKQFSGVKQETFQKKICRAPQLTQGYASRSWSI